MLAVQIPSGVRMMLANLDHLNPHYSFRSGSSWQRVRQLWLPVDTGSSR